MSDQKYIRMATMNPIVLTPEEYERLANEVRGRILAEDAGIGDIILCRLLEEYAYRYNEIKLGRG